MVLLSYPTDKRAWVSACPSMKCFLFTAISIKDLCRNCPYAQTTGTDVTFHMWSDTLRLSCSSWQQARQDLGMYSSRWIGGITFLGPNLLSRSNSHCIVLHQAHRCVNYVKQGNDHLFSYSLTHRAPLSSLQPYTTCRFVSDLHIISKNIPGEDNVLCSYQEGRYICLLTTIARRNRILKHRNDKRTH